MKKVTIFTNRDFLSSTLAFCLRLVFFFGRDAAADMALAQIEIQYFSRLFIQFRIDIAQAFGNVFMYRRFTNGKMRGARPSGTARFDDVFRAF